MAKRFTDTEKYKDPWFRKLSPTSKVLFLFMCDDCNHAGIWKENLETFNFIFKMSASKEEIDSMGDKVIKVSPETYLIHSFIKFQYGKLNPENKAHLGVIRALSYIDIDYTPYLAPSKELHSPQGIGIGTGTGEEAGNGVGTGKVKTKKEHIITTDDVPF
jgi:hypothetical protein